MIVEELMGVYLNISENNDIEVGNIWTAWNSQTILIL